MGMGSAGAAGDAAAGDACGPGPTRAGRRVLVIDDDPLVRVALHRALSADLHEVTVAASGAAALDLLARERFDLVLSDLDLGDRVAPVAIAEAARDHGLLVFMSGSHPSAATLAVLRRAAAGFVAKPFALKLLRALAGDLAVPAAEAS